MILCRPSSARGGLGRMDRTTKSNVFALGGGHSNPVRKGVRAEVAYRPFFGCSSAPSRNDRFLIPLPVALIYKVSSRLSPSAASRVRVIVIFSREKARRPLSAHLQTRREPDGKEPVPPTSRVHPRRRIYLRWRIRLGHESGRKGRRERAAFDKMFAAAEDRKFDVLLFWSLNRFSREGIRFGDCLPSAARRARDRLSLLHRTVPQHRKRAGAPHPAGRALLPRRDGSEEDQPPHEGGPRKGACRRKTDRAALEVRPVPPGTLQRTRL